MFAQLSNNEIYWVSSTNVGSIASTAKYVAQRTPLTCKAADKMFVENEQLMSSGYLYIYTCLLI